MTASDLVDSWFPADLSTPQEWEARYPERGLPPGAETTRFAPSPTGSMHLGGLYVAMLAQQAARASAGVYLVRIEDTDTKREVAGAAEEFDRVLGYFGLRPDEGDPDGGWGPYRQSQREQVYLSFARDLARRGLAYPCFCGPETLAADAAEQQSTRSPRGYYGKWARCRALGPEQVQRRIAAGEPFSLRFRCPVGLPGRVGFTDRIRGRLSMLDNGNDAVLLKSTASGGRLPTYHFAHVVDDHLMRVTLVIRGDEWISSLPLHRQLHTALGFQAPQYAHIAPLMKVEGPSRRKLSKRKDPESAASFYLAAGYPAAAVQHYLRGLADNRLIDLPTAVALREEIRLERTGLAGPMVEVTRLRAVSRDHIASLAPEEALAGLDGWAAGHDPGLHRLLAAQPALALRAMEMAHRGTGRPRKDLACWQEFRDQYGFLFAELHTLVTDPADRRFGGPDPRVVAGLVDGYRQAGPAEEWYGWLRALADSCRTPVREVANVLRVCLVGRTRSPDLFQIVQALGEDEVLRRLRPLREATRALRAA
jgi:glutamyl-tRNA synthetase